jgi:hypothetical protein
MKFKKSNFRIEMYIVGVGMFILFLISVFYDLVINTSNGSFPLIFFTCSKCSKKMVHSKLQNHLKRCLVKDWYDPILKDIRSIQYCNVSDDIYDKWINIDNQMLHHTIRKWRLIHGQIQQCSNDEIAMYQSTTYYGKKTVFLLDIKKVTCVFVYVDGTFNINESYKPITDKYRLKIARVVKEVMVDEADHVRKVKEYLNKEDEISTMIVGCTPDEAFEKLRLIGY